MPDSINMLELTGIHKTFPGVQALRGVDLCVSKGEVHALLGENGAGKTTLMNIVYGLYQPDSGQIAFCGNEVKVGSPKEAISLGIGMVHQHFKVIPAFTVQENIIMGLKTKSYPMLNFREVQGRLAQLSERYGFQVQPEVLVSSLTIGEKQRLEILKAIYRDAKLLILDEPTTVLTVQEVQMLFSNIRMMIQDGRTVILISHKLDEVLDIADRITVLRNGGKIGTVNRREADKNQLARMMVGHDLILDFGLDAKKPGKPLLEVRHLTAFRKDGRKALDDVNLELREGEILGLAGISGNGQRELVDCILGINRRNSGDILLNNCPISKMDSRARFDAGLAHIPEDRFAMGILPSFPLFLNLILGLHRKRRFARYGMLKLKETKRNAEQQIAEYNIKTPSSLLPIKNLSGGNIQKVIIAREFSKEPQVLIADKPTIGLDVAATDYIHQKLLELKNQQRAILLISEDLDEIFQFSDRIAIITRGKIVSIDHKEHLNKESVGLQMTA